MSPAPLGSSLITRAPKSASMVEQKGPARAWLRSMTVTSSSGRRMWFVSSRPMVAQRRREVAAEVLRYHGPGERPLREEQLPVAAGGHAVGPLAVLRRGTA